MSDEGERGLKKGVTAAGAYGDGGVEGLGAGDSNGDSGEISGRAGGGGTRRR